MGIYLPDMEMPKEGEYRMTLYVCDDGYAYMDVDLFPVDKDRFEAVPIPPHGRLIDADAALRDGWTISRTYSASPAEMVYEVKAIDCLPTIIPAEEGE